MVHMFWRNNIRSATSLRHYQAAHRNRTFIVKPNASCQGKGIFLTRDLSEIDFGNNYVVQRYMHRVCIGDRVDMHWTRSHLQSSMRLSRVMVCVSCSQGSSYYHALPLSIQAYISPRDSMALLLIALGSVCVCVCVRVVCCLSGMCGARRSCSPAISH
jgi:hypothetical protein